MNAIAAKQDVAAVRRSIRERDCKVCVGLVYPRQAFGVVDCNSVLLDRSKENLKKVVAQDAHISMIIRFTGAARSIPVGEYFALH